MLVGFRDLDCCSSSSCQGEIALGCAAGGPRAHLPAGDGDEVDDGGDDGGDAASQLMDEGDWAWCLGDALTASRSWASPQ